MHYVKYKLHFCEIIEVSIICHVMFLIQDVTMSHEFEIMFLLIIPGFQLSTLDKGSVETHLIYNSALGVFSQLDYSQLESHTSTMHNRSTGLKSCQCILP